MGANKRVEFEGKKMHCVSFVAVSEQDYKNFKRAVGEFEKTKDQSATNLPIFTKKWIDRGVLTQDKLTYLVADDAETSVFGSDDACFVEAVPVFAVRDQDGGCQVKALSEDEILFIENYTSAVRSSTDKPSVRRRFGKTSKPWMLNSVLSFDNKSGREIKFPMYPTRIFPLTSVWVRENGTDVERECGRVSVVDASGVFCGNGEPSTSAPAPKAAAKPKPAGSSGGNVRPLLDVLHGFYASSTGASAGAPVTFDWFCRHVDVDAAAVTAGGGVDKSAVGEQWKLGSKALKRKRSELEAKLREKGVSPDDVRGFAECIKKAAFREHTINVARALNA